MEPRALPAAGEGEGRPGWGWGEPLPPRAGAVPGRALTPSGTHRPPPAPPPGLPPKRGERGESPSAKRSPAGFERRWTEGGEGQQGNEMRRRRVRPRQAKNFSG